MSVRLNLSKSLLSSRIRRCPLRQRMVLVTSLIVTGIVLPHSLFAESQSVVGDTPETTPPGSSVEEAPTQEKNFSNTPQPPAPWTPISVTQNGWVEVWGRQMRFADEPWPVAMTSQGHDVLAGQIQFDLGFNQPIRWQAPRVIESTPERLILEGVGSVGTLRLPWHTEVEFDGTVTIRLTLQPEAPIPLPRAVLQIPVTSSSLLLHGPVGTNVGPDLLQFLLHHTALRPWVDQLPPGGWSGGFTPEVWVGDSNRGLAWFSDSSEGWLSPNSAGVVQVLRQEDTAVLRVNVRRQPSVLSQPLVWSFGLLATPSRPLPKHPIQGIVTSGSGSLAQIRKRFLEPGARLPDSVTAHLTSPFSLHIRVALSDPNAKQFLLGSDAISVMYDGTTAQLHVGLLDDTGAQHDLAVPWTPARNQPIVLTVTHDGKQLSGYADGRLMGAVEAPFRVEATGYQPFCIGVNPWGSWGLNGTVTSVALFTRALTPEDVARFSSGGTEALQAAHPLAFWDFRANYLHTALLDRERDHLHLIPSATQGTAVSPTLLEGQGLQFHGAGLEVTGNPAGLTGLELAARRGVQGIDLVYGWSDVWGFPVVADAEKRQLLHDLVDAARPLGIHILPYTSLQLVSEHAPCHGPWVNPGSQTKELGEPVHIMQLTPEFEHCFLEAAQQVISEFHLDGWFLDNTDVQATPLEGGRGIAYDQAQLRHLQTGFYRMMVAADENHHALVLHHSSPSMLIRDPFADVLATGEMHYWFMFALGLDRHTVPELATRIPPSQIEGWFSGRPFGMATTFVLKRRDKVYHAGDTTKHRGELFSDEELAALQEDFSLHPFGGPPDTADIANTELSPTDRVSHLRPSRPERPERSPRPERPPRP